MKNLINEAVKRNEKESFPVWGTCLGFEALITAFFTKEIKLREIANQFKNSNLILRNFKNSDNFLKILNS